MSGNPFDELKNAFKPIGTGLDGDTAPGLPMGVTIVGERMRYGDAFTVAQEIELGVREDGPDAYSPLVIVPQGGAYRWNGGDWMRSTEEKDKRLFMERAGSVLEVVYVKEGMPCWEKYRGIEW